MHIKTFTYLRTFKLERILKDTEYKYEPLVLGGEIAYNEGDDIKAGIRKLKDEVRDQLVEEVTKAREFRAKEQAKKQETK